MGRAEGMVKKLSAIGLEIDWERVKEIAGDGAIGRPHVAQALVEKGHVRSVSEAFDLYIGRDGPAYVGRVKLTPADAIRLIQSVGGRAVLATRASPATSSPCSPASRPTVSPGWRSTTPGTPAIRLPDSNASPTSTA